MRSDKQPWHASLLPVRGRWARYSLCLALVVGAYALFLYVIGAVIPISPYFPGAPAAFSMAGWAWRIMADTHPAEAHRAGGQRGALIAGILAGGVTWCAVSPPARSVSLLAAIVAVPLGVLIGGTVGGSRAAARERRTGYVSSELSD